MVGEAGGRTQEVTQPRLTAGLINMRRIRRLSRRGTGRQRPGRGAEPEGDKSQRQAGDPIREEEESSVSRRQNSH